MNTSTVLRQARHRSGLTLRALAARAGTSHATLSAYESGRKVPTVATLDRILRAAGFAPAIDLVTRGVPDDRGEELEAVLRLAALFPARHDAELHMPVFGRASVPTAVGTTAP